MVKVDKSSFFNLVDKYQKEDENFFASSDANNVSIMKKCPLSSPKLMYYFGPGGLCYTRIHQIYGPEHSGKTTFVILIAKEMQREVPKKVPGKDIILWLDFERTFDPYHAKNLGLDISPEKFFLLQPDSGEEGWQKAMNLIKTGAVAMVVLDSDAAMPTEAELSSDEINKATYGAQAKLMSSISRNLNNLCSKYDTLWFDISQERVDPTIRVSYGGPVKKATGGDVIKFYSVTRTKIKKVGNIEDKNGEIIGIICKVTNIKNKQGGGAKPFRSIDELRIYFNGGINPDEEYEDLIIKYVKLGDLQTVTLSGRTYTVWDLSGPEPVEVTKQSSTDKFLSWLTDPASEAWYDKIKREVDSYQSKSSTLDQFNVVVDENDDGIDQETEEEMIEKRVEAQKKADEKKKALLDKIEDQPLNLDEE